jgi:hypothetical protein
MSPAAMIASALLFILLAARLIGNRTTCSLGLDVYLGKATAYLGAQLRSMQNLRTGSGKWGKLKRRMKITW